MEGWMDGCVDVRKDGWMVGRMEMDGTGEWVCESICGGDLGACKCL